MMKPHRTTLTIHTRERGLHEDYKRWVEWLAPFDASPERDPHNRTGEDHCY